MLAFKLDIQKADCKTEHSYPELESYILSYILRQKL